MVELRARQPMVDLRLLSGRLFRSTSVVMFLRRGGVPGPLYLIPLYFQDARVVGRRCNRGSRRFPRPLGS